MNYSAPMIKHEEIARHVVHITRVSTDDGYVYYVNASGPLFRKFCYGTNDLDQAMSNYEALVAQVREVVDNQQVMH